MNTRFKRINNNRKICSHIHFYMTSSIPLTSTAYIYSNECRTVDAR